jgi:hypothetical protein
MTARSSRGRFGRKVDPEHTAKTKQAIELRIAGHSWQEIATKLGFAGKSGAFKLVQNALREQLREPAEELRQIEFVRLEAMTLGLWKRAKRGDVGAIDRVLKLMDRRAKLLGLDLSPDANTTPVVPPKIVIQYADAADADPVQPPAVGDAPGAATGNDGGDAVGTRSR